jgi:hypothetical protein
MFVAPPPQKGNKLTEDVNPPGLRQNHSTTDGQHHIRSACNVVGMTGFTFLHRKYLKTANYNNFLDFIQLADRSANTPSSEMRRS